MVWQLDKNEKIDNLFFFFFNFLHHGSVRMKDSTLSFIREKYVPNRPYVLAKVPL